MNPDLERLHPYPFEKLGTLFADLPASDKSPVAFSIGDCLSVGPKPVATFSRRSLCIS